MRSKPVDKLLETPLTRRAVVGAAAGAAAFGITGSQALAQSDKSGVDPAVWTPEHIKEIAGTLQVDTAADVAKVTPLDYSGELSFWYVGPTEATSELEKKINGENWDAWAKTYPGIPLKIGENLQNIGYNDLLDKIRTAATGKAAPSVAKMPIL